MSKLYHYVVIWSEEEGWQIDSEGEESAFRNGTIYNNETRCWEFGYLGEGKYNGKEEELTETLTDILDLHNTMKGIKNDRYL